MADNKSFQQYLGVPEYSPSVPVNRMGGSGTTLQTLSNLGSQAIEVNAEFDKSSKLALLDEAYTKLNQEYFQRDPASNDAAVNATTNEAGVVAGQMQMLTQNPTFQTGEQVDKAYSNLEGAQKDLQDKLVKFKQAREQGAMSSYEYETRALDLTRELVAKNPHLSRELLGQLSLNMNLTGMQQRIKYAESQRASSQEQMDNEIKFQRQRLKDLGLEEKIYTNPETGEFDISSARRAQIGADKRLAQLHKARLVDEALKNKEAFNKADALQLVESGQIYDIADGKYASLKLGLAQLKQEFPNWSDYKVKALELVGKSTADLAENYKGLISLNPEIERIYTLTQDRFKNLEENISKSESGEFLNTRLTNEEKITDALEKAGIRKQGINLEATRLFSTMSTNPIFMKLLDKDGSGKAVEILSKAANVINSAARLTSSDFTALPSGGTTAGIVEQAVTTNVQKYKGTGKSTEVFNQVIGDKLSAIDKLESPQDQFKANQETIVNISKPENAEALQYLSPENKTKLEALISSQNAPLFKALVESKASGVQFQISPDGLLMTTNTGSDEASVKLRTQVIDRINDSLKGFAALKGIGTKAAAESFYNQFYKNTFDNRDIPKVDYMSQAKETLPRIAMRESGGKFYTPDGQYITSPKGAFGKFQLMVKTAMNPGYGIKPLDFSKSGPAFDKDQERFATEYYATMLKENNGDEKKALASYNWGIGNVKALETRFGSDWFTKGQALPEKDPLKIPKETVLYVNALSKDAKNSDALISKSLASYGLIEKSQPAVAATLWTSPAEKAKYIANEINQENPGLNVTWEQVAQKLDTSTPRKVPLTKEEMDKAFKTGESLFKKSSGKVSTQPVSESTKAYAEASKVASQQRQQVYDAIDKGVSPVAALVNAGLGILEGAVVDLATLPSKAAWDMEHYRATGELRRKGTTKGMTPNLDKSLEQFSRGQ